MELEMSQDRTSGFDIVIQISENELNAQVSAAFASGLFFPSSFSAPVIALGLTGRMDLNLSTPLVDLDRPRPQLGLTIPFFNSQFEITAPLPLTATPLSGTILIVDSVQMRDGAGTQQAIMDFTAGASSVTLNFSPSTRSMMLPLLATVGVTVAQAEAEFANQVRNQLVMSVQRLPITPPIPVNDKSSLLFSTLNVQVTTVNDSSAADRDALVFGINTSPELGVTGMKAGNINGITKSFLTGDSSSLLMLSNTWLLSYVIRFKLARALNLNGEDFDKPCRLNRSVTAPGGGATLTNLEARVVGDRIRVDGSATRGGAGWSAVATFSFFIVLALESGSLKVTSTTPVMDVDVSLEWWVWLASIGSGGLFGNLIGAIVGAIVPAVVEAVVEGLVDGMLSSSIGNNLGGEIASFPLGPIGRGITLKSLTLDDLELRGPVQRSLALPTKSSGEFVGLNGFTLDLDAGTVHGANNTSAKIDLRWHPAEGFDTRNGCGFSVSGNSYDALTPVQLRAMGLSNTHMNAFLVPPSSSQPLFGPSNELVLGVRTSQGRLAKVRAWREVLDSGALHIHWTTFATPIPTLDIALRWTVLESAAEGVTYIGKDDAVCVRKDVSRRATLEAWPRLVTFPVNYRWCLSGQVLEQGKGEINVAGGTLLFELEGRYLTIDTEMGHLVDCELCVSAIDAIGGELFSCVPLKCDASETYCGRSRPVYPKAKLEWIPCDPLRAVVGFESVNSERVRAQILNALVTEKSLAVGLK
jgi:hypothetical protein